MLRRGMVAPKSARVSRRLKPTLLTPEFDCTVLFKYYIVNDTFGGRRLDISQRKGAEIAEKRRGNMDRGVCVIARRLRGLISLRGLHLRERPRLRRRVRFLLRGFCSHFPSSGVVRVARRVRDRRAGVCGSRAGLRGDERRVG